MAPTPTSPAREPNRLLASLPPAVYEGLLPRLESVRLHQKQVLAAADEPISHAVFPRGAVISLLAPMETGMAVEAATVGFEGLVGVPLFLGEGTAANDAVVQVEGDAARMPAAAFRQAAAASPDLDNRLRRYTLALMGHMSRSAGCNRAHPVEQRCARWLLLIHDRVGSDTFMLTHEFLAAMLGVRRASVTIVAGQLQRAGLIHYRRGVMTILDREGLEATACEDYRLTQDRYERLYASLPASTCRAAS